MLPADPVERFYAALEALPADARNFPVGGPRFPREHFDGAESSSGWAPWKVIRNSTPHDYSELEEALPAPLPPTFKRWHSAAFTVDLDLGALRLWPARFGAPMAELEDALSAWDGLEDGPLELGLIPFGDDANDAGPLCFDTTVARPDGEWPVTCWDHDSREKGPIIASSFSALLELAIRLIPIRALEGVDADEARAKALREVMELDPLGAGSQAGFSYWSFFVSDELEFEPTSEMRARWMQANPADDFHSQRALLFDAEALAEDEGTAAQALEALRRVTHAGLAAGRVRAELRAMTVLGRSEDAARQVRQLVEEWLGPRRPEGGVRTDIDPYELIDLIEAHATAGEKSALVDRVRREAAL